MPKEPERELRVMVNQGRREIDLVLLADGHPLGSIRFTQEQAENHARAVIEAIEMVNAAKSSIILPGRSH
jgi:hypothetical protein